MIRGKEKKLKANKVTVREKIKNKESRRKRKNEKENVC